MALRSLCGESEQAMPNIIIKDIIEVDIYFRIDSRLSGRKIAEMTGINRETIRKALLLIGKV